jgi:hypothetical protein
VNKICVKALDLTTNKIKRRYFDGKEKMKALNLIEKVISTKNMAVDWYNLEEKNASTR